jgi:hypothetical protein
LIVIQFLMVLLGIAGDHDTDGGGGYDAGGHDHGGADHHEAAGHSATNWVFGVLTLRTIVAALAFFGLTGMALVETDVSETLRFLAALGAGLVALFIVSFIMRSLGKMNVDGTVRIENALGARGTVYLSIPSAKSGAGKVHVTVQGRRVEYRAMTAFGQLPTGSKIVVVAVLNADTVEVNPVESLEEASHS